MPDSCPAFGCTNRRSTTSLQFYCIPSAKRYPEQRITKWVTAKNDRLRKQTTHIYAVLILQLMSHRSFQKHVSFLQFFLSANKKLVLRVSNMAQVIKKIYLPFRAKSNDPLHIVYVPYVFKFTKILAKGIQESLKRSERAQKRLRRLNVTTGKVFTVPYICNISRVASLHYFHFFIICRNYLPNSVLLYFSTFIILIANLERKRFDI